MFSKRKTLSFILGLFLTIFSGISHADWYDSEFCWMETYGRGVGTIPKVAFSFNCNADVPNTEYDAGLCYQPCKHGYDGVGPVCWAVCPKSHPVSCGLGCATDSDACKEAVVDQVFSVFDAALSLAGASGISEVKNLSKAGEKFSKLAKSIAEIPACKNKSDAECIDALADYFIARGEDLGIPVSATEATKFARTAVKNDPDGWKDFAADAISGADPTGITGIVLAYAKPVCYGPEPLQKFTIPKPLKLNWKTVNIGGAGKKLQTSIGTIITRAIDMELDSKGMLWAITGSYPKTSGSYNKIYREGSTQAISGPTGENAVRLDVAGNVLRVVTASGKLFIRSPSTGAWTQYDPPSPEDKFVEVDTKGGRLWGVIKRSVPSVKLGKKGVERTSISSYRLATYGGGKWNTASDARGTRQLALVDGVKQDGYQITYYEAWRLNSKGLLERKYRLSGSLSGSEWVFPGKQVADTFLRIGHAMDSNGPHGAVTLSILGGLKFYDGQNWYSDPTALGLRVKMSRAAFWMIDLLGNIKVGYRRDGHVKSALTNDAGATYLFYKDGKYARTSKDKTSGFDSGYPTKMPGGWRGVPTDWYNRIDAAVSYNGSSRNYMFSPITSTQLTSLNPLPGYLRMSGGTVDSGYPKQMPGGWRGLPSGWANYVQAALYAKENNRHYFFFGDEYVRLNGVTVDAGPVKLSKFAGGTLPIAFWGGIDAATYRNGHVYLIKGDQYVRVTRGRMDAGYPKPLVGNWPK